MSRFFTDSSAIGDRDITITNKDDIKHLSKVLRLKVGDKADISDSVRWEYKGEITEISLEKVVLKILDKQSFSAEPELAVTLFQGIPKSGKMEFIIQKTVELGVSSIVPVFMDRTVVVEKGNFSKKLERWQKISDEAVKQCKRGIIPSVEGQLNFAQMTDRLAEFDLVLFPYENEKGYSIKDCLRGLESKPRTAAVIIGPEGGFSDREAAALMEDTNVRTVTLGKTILRTETAGMAALAMVMYELEM